ncbi:MAG TPA: tetratricopeptide repeat protein [Phenylobacterium sp.]|nr:tetratricopeptide repeat protein [Phenylobacterium sp.]
MKRSLVAAYLALLSTPAWAQASGDMPPGMGQMGHSMHAMPSVYAGQADKAGAPTFKGLGDHHHPISTRNPDTQRYFDQGVNLLFGFNHAEAIRSFREAARLDPDCAMCWWGVAVALGPNINLPMPPDAVAPAWEALERARALAPRASPAERAWIAALGQRYSPDPKADRHALDEAYAKAMGDLVRSQPDDLDAATFYVEAMMDTQPWDYWQADAVTPKGHGAEIVSTLERVIARAPSHPGALHLYIHAVEASTTPERAEAAADRLLTLMPEAGHIVHMPSHIYYRVGRYSDAARANELAATVDEAYIAACRAQGYYPAGYYGHNIHFLWTSSEMEGRRQVSLDAARRLVKAVDAVETAKTLPQAELFVFTPIVTLVRFGQWDAVLAEPAPPEQLRLDTAVWLYARGFAHANRGDLKAALADRARLAEISGGDFSAYEGAGVPAKPMTDLALALLDGEISRKSGVLDGAIVRFRHAADLERALPYTEPPWWHQPVSHLLGAALLEAGQAKEAEAVYRQSLTSYRRDGWALLGLAQALEAQGKTAEAATTRAAFEDAWRLSDVRLTASRL